MWLNRYPWNLQQCLEPLQNNDHMIPPQMYQAFLLGMSSIWSGSIHFEINDFDVKSMCQYAQSMCRGQYMCAKYTFLSGKKLPQKTVNGILTSSTTCYIHHMCLFRSTLFPNKSTCKISIANINKTRCLLSGIHLGYYFCHAQDMCAKYPKWLRP